MLPINQHYVEIICIFTFMIIYCRLENYHWSIASYLSAKHVYYSPTWFVVKLEYYTHHVISIQIIQEKRDLPKNVVHKQCTNNIKMIFFFIQKKKTLSCSLYCFKRYFSLASVSGEWSSNTQQRSYLTVKKHSHVNCKINFVSCFGSQRSFIFSHWVFFFYFILREFLYRVSSSPAAK